MTLSSFCLHERLYAFTQAVLKWRHYLLGWKFIIKTYRKSLKELMYQVIQIPKQKFYLSKLFGFQYEIVYRAGKSNQMANALSQVEELLNNQQHTLFDLTTAQHEIFVALMKANLEHPQLQKLYLLLIASQLEESYVVREGLLCYKNKILVPDQGTLV